MRGIRGAERTGPRRAGRAGWRAGSMGHIGVLYHPLGYPSHSQGSVQSPAPGMTAPFPSSPPPPSLTCCHSAVTSSTGRVGQFIPPLFHLGPFGGGRWRWGHAAAGAASRPARPSSSTLPGCGAPTPSTHGHQVDPECRVPPVAPTVDVTEQMTMVQIRTLGAGSDRHRVNRSSTTPTTPNAVTPLRPARRLGGHLGVTTF